MGKVFSSQKAFNPHPGQYSYSEWNKVPGHVDEAYHMRNIGVLARGNFHTFVMVLLGYIFTRDAGEWQWVKKK